MLSWDEFDKEDSEVAAVKGANAGHASEANMDRLDSAGMWDATLGLPEQVERAGAGLVAVGFVVERLGDAVDEMILPDGGHDARAVAAARAPARARPGQRRRAQHRDHQDRGDETPAFRLEIITASSLRMVYNRICLR